jgi:leucyl-tRNA synthetase
MLARAAWPKFVPELAAQDQVEVVVQLNGRVKGRLLVEAGLGKDELKNRAMADSKVAQLLDGQRVLKVVVVPDKLVNLVVG